MSKEISQNVNTSKRGQYAEKVLTMLQVYFENHKMCDVVLVAANDGTRVSAHRVVLSACSLYFLDMFSNNGERNEVQLEDVSGHVLEVLIHFCYSGHIEFQKDNVELYLTAATQLQLTDVVKAGSDYLVQELHPSYCLKVAQIAEKYNCNDALRQADACTHQHYMEVCGSDDFFQLNVGQLCRIIGSDDLVVNSEEDVFNSCISWIDHDRKDRETYFLMLLALVRLQLLPLPFINDQVKPLCKTIECKDLIIEAMAWHLQPEKDTKLRKRIQLHNPSIISSPPKQANKSTDEILMLIRKEPFNDFSTFEIYNSSEDKWCMWNKGHIWADLYFELDGLLLGAAGSDVTSYDFKTPPVTTTSSLNTPRKLYGRGVLGSYLYCVGGVAFGDTLNCVERWNPKDRLWNCVAPMKAKRYSLGVAALGECLYAVGGYFNSCRRSVQRYDPKTNVWTLRAIMNHARSDFQLVAANGYLYAVGGQTDNGRTATAERYDPVADKWTMICSISSARCLVSCVFFGNRLMAVGDKNSNQPQIVEEYDIATNQWTRKKPLPQSDCSYKIFTLPKQKFPNLPK